MLDTIKSRSLEIKIILKEYERIKIIKELIKFYSIDAILDPEYSKLTPGNFLELIILLMNMIFHQQITLR